MSLKKMTITLKDSKTLIQSYFFKISGRFINFLSMSFYVKDVPVYTYIYISFLRLFYMGFN